MRRSKIISRKEATKIWDAAMLRYFGYWYVPVALIAAWIGERALQALGL